MLCPKCKSDNKSTAVFCISCGYKLFQEGNVLFGGGKQTRLSPYKQEEDKAEEDGKSRQGRRKPLYETVISGGETEPPPIQREGRESRKEDRHVGKFLQQERYRIQKCIGAGGMGKVYLAHDRRMDCSVVIKEMLSLGYSQEEREYLTNRFIEEAKLLFRLKHGGLPKVTDYFQEDDKLYIIMEYIQGKTLSEKAKEFPQGRIPFYLALQWMKEVLHILNYLHNQDPPVIHRDIKPNNIMVTTQGTVYLVDFGVARTVHKEKTSTTVGTYGFASPENFSGRFLLSSDIYSLGATFHFLLSGHNPQDREAFDFPPLSQYRPDIPPQFELILNKMLAHKKGERYSHVKEVLNHLTFLEVNLEQEEKGQSQREGTDTPAFKEARPTVSINFHPTAIMNDKRKTEKITVAEDMKNGKGSSGTKPSVPPMVVIIVLILLAGVVLNFIRNLNIGMRMNQQGKKLLEERNYEGAEEKFSIAIQKFPKLYQAYIGRAVACRKLGKYDHAKQDLEKAVTMKPRDPEVYCEFSRLSLEQRETLTAMKSVEKCLEIKPDYPPGILQRGIIYMETGEFQKALKDFERFVQLSPPPSVEDKLREAEKLLAEGKYEEAKADYEAMLETSPLSWEVYYGRGRALAEMKEHEPALWNFSMALEMEPEKGEIFSYRGFVYLEMKRYQEALDDLNRGIQLDPQDVSAYNNRGFLFLESKKYQEAMKDLNKALELIPDYEEALINRGNCFYYMEKYDEALQDYNRSIKNNPDNPQAYVGRGLVYYEKGFKEKAQSDWNKVIELDPAGEDGKTAKEYIEKYINDKDEQDG